MIITQNLKKWGNGTGVRIPKKVRQAANLEVDQPLEVSLQGRSIVLTPIDKADNFTLDDMLSGVTPDKVHAELDWGADAGAEKIDD